MNPFAFLQAEWPDVFDAATRAASAVHPDPCAACFYARRALDRESVTAVTELFHVGYWLAEFIAERLNVSYPHLPLEFVDFVVNHLAEHGVLHRIKASARAA
ncbi:MAG: hypothetical protein AB7O93_24085 [Vicinamibacterales bacterium]